MTVSDYPPGFNDLREFGLIDALLGRRSRRFFMGAEIPDRVFAFKSKKELTPLSEIEKLLVVAACGGNTAWGGFLGRLLNYNFLIFSKLKMLLFTEYLTALY